MLNVGALVFASPWMLAALAALPAIWWLLRVTPPAPRRLRFPAIRLLADLVAREETPERTPWWLLLLRLVLAALVIVALARPVFNPAAALPGSGPVLLVVDNGWAAARDWPARQRLLRELIDRAERQNRPLLLLPTAAAAPGEKPALSGLLRPAEARAAVETLAPLPWPADRAAALAALRGFAPRGSVHAVWLTDGLDSPSARPLAERLQRLGSVEAVLPGPGRTAHLLLPPAIDGSVLVARVLRAEAAGAETLWLRATAADGRLLGRQEATLADGALTAEVPFDLPVELRNAAVRLDIENEATAGAVVLLDDRWRRRPVGVVAGNPQGEAQPLLSDAYYLTRALEPFAEVRRGELRALLDSGVAVLLRPDTGALAPEEATALGRWLDGGGVLLRFAGPFLAAHPDPLVPVRLRAGDRMLSGALSWTEPMPLAPFAAESPFHGLPVPGDIRVQRQVLAEPTVDLGDRTWARLADGTPLVTAAPRGAGGWLVLIHTTAGPEWSNLPLSGLFVDLLRRIVALSGGVPGETGAVTLAPLRTLDGFGRLGQPPATAVPIPPGGFAEARLGPQHPPGFYGTEEARRALNLGAKVTGIAALPDLPGGVVRGSYAARGEVDLLPWLLGAALALAASDLLLGLALRGLLPWPRGRGLAGGAAALLAAAVLAGVAAGPRPALAQTAGPAQGQVRSPAQGDDAFALRAANQTWLAYVRTGDAQVDEVSRAGLESLGTVLRDRTAVETAGAMAVDVAQDELAFFPLLYWPVIPRQPDLAPPTVARLNAFLRNGGTILFDTRDQGLGGVGGGPGAQRLRTLTAGLDIPPLVPVPPDHVLTKSFYLMQDFPGRQEGGELWVENSEEHINDGVSSVIIGANDWASAWATDAAGRPMFPVVPGGERQREMAYRFGVNLVMYALTGNYKADQVHVPAILERLGQ